MIRASRVIGAITACVLAVQVFSPGGPLGILHAEDEPGEPSALEPRVELRIEGLPSDRLGMTLLGAPDGEGRVQDLLVGAPFGPSGTAPGAGSVVRVSAVDGTVLWKMAGTEPHENVGAALAVLTDLDGDEVPEVLVGAPGRNGASGAVDVRSGATGAVLQTWLDPDEDRVLFGSALAVVGDLGDDGIPEVLVGAPQLFGPGVVLLCSGSDGSPLETFRGDQNGDRFGATVAGFGDLDDDGVLDFGIGAPDRSEIRRGEQAAMGFAGSVTVYSGATREVLYERRGSLAGRRLGDSLVGLADVDGDGVSDFLIGGWGVAGADGGATGAAFIVSGADGGLVRRFDGEAKNDRYGEFLSALPDLDGDGVEDLLIGAASADPRDLEDAGSAYLLSSVSGELIARVDGAKPGEGLGLGVAVLEDLNGGGVPEFALSSPFYSSEDKGAAGAVVVVAFDDAPPPPVACTLAFLEDTLEGCAGEPVPSVLELREASEVRSLSVGVQFDPQGVLVLEVLPGDLVEGREFLASIDNQAGEVHVEVSGSDPLGVGGELAQIVLIPQASDGLGGSDLLLDGTVNGDHEICRAESGRITTLDCTPDESSISGSVSYYRIATEESDRLPVPGVRLALNGDTTREEFSRTDGTFGFVDVPGGSYTLQAEKNGDRLDAVSALDLSLVARHVVGLYPFDDVQTRAADVSGDGVVTSLDASLLAQHVVGSLARFPAAEERGSDWLFLPESRSLETVEGMLEGQDFTAIVLGDVTANWSSGAGLRAGSGTAPETSAAELKLRLLAADDRGVWTWRLSLPENRSADSVEFRIELGDGWDYRGVNLPEQEVDRRGRQVLVAESDDSETERGKRVLLFGGERLVSGQPVLEILLSPASGFEGETLDPSNALSIVSTSIGLALDDSHSQN